MRELDVDNPQQKRGPRKTDVPATKRVSAHPLAALQDSIGNAAVSRLAQIQRHSIDPEEEME